MAKGSNSSTLDTSQVRFRTIQCFHSSAFRIRLLKNIVNAAGPYQHWNRFTFIKNVSLNIWHWIGPAIYRKSASYFFIISNYFLHTLWNVFQYIIINHYLLKSNIIKSVYKMYQVFTYFSHFIVTQFTTKPANTQIAKLLILSSLIQSNFKQNLDWVNLNPKKQCHKPQINCSTLTLCLTFPLWQTPNALEMGVEITN